MGYSMVGVHVDDMAAVSSNTTKMHTLIWNLQKVLDLVDMGNIKWFLGIKITHNHDAQIIMLS